MKIFKLLLLLFCIGSFVSNIQAQYVKNSKTTKVEVIFEHPAICAPSTILREYFNNCEYCYKSTITDTFKLKMLDSLLNGLKINSEKFIFNNIILCKLYYNDGSYKELILGTFSGTIFNRVQMKDNNDLNFFIKNEIGFYDLMEVEYLHIFRELKNEEYLNNVILNHRKIQKFDCKILELPSED
ncbi:MAG: hypothetical protein H6Q25_289 [Bacteroidetes bacterium]|nr:hypothetical protein [Bacteroidota bacterium]